MNTFELQVFAEQRMADRLREAEHERLVRELRVASGGEGRPRTWSIRSLRRMAGSVRSAFATIASLAEPRAALPRSRD